MRKMNKLLAGLISLSLAVSVSAMPALAAEGDTSSTEPTTYVVTFRPGEHGRFTDSFIDDLKACGEVRTSEATGAVAVQLDEGDTLPNAPQLTDIVMNEDASLYFVTDAAQGYTGGTAGGDLDAVAQYTLRASTEDAVFTVQYLDRETGAEVAPTLAGLRSCGPEPDLLRAEQHRELHRRGGQPAADRFRQRGRERGDLLLHRGREQRDRDRDCAGRHRYPV